MSGAANRLLVVVDSYLEICRQDEGNLKTESCLMIRDKEGEQAGVSSQGKRAHRHFIVGYSTCTSSSSSRLRAALREQRVTHSVCHEYTSNAKLSRTRQAFFKGDVPLLVATSRFCFYRRYRLSGAQRIIFLGLPCSPEVYVHLLTESLPAAADTPAGTAAAAGAAAGAATRVEGTALCYYTRFDLHSLERLMPLRQALQLLQAPQGRVIALS
ncbi:hypothetical protein ACSSS7_002086 [Eimeria intestinalis]